MSTLLRFDIDYGREKGLGLGIVVERRANEYVLGLIFLCFWFEVIW